MGIILWIFFGIVFIYYSIILGLILVEYSLYRDTGSYYKYVSYLNPINLIKELPYFKRREYISYIYENFDHISKKLDNIYVLNLLIKYNLESAISLSVDNYLTDYIVNSYNCYMAKYYAKKSGELTKKAIPDLVIFFLRGWVERERGWVSFGDNEKIYNIRSELINIFYNKEKSKKYLI